MPGELTVRWNLNHYARLVKYGPDRKPCNAGARNDRLFCVFGVTFKFNDALKSLSMIILVLEIQWSTDEDHSLLLHHWATAVKEERKCFNDALNTFYLWLYGIGTYGLKPLR